MYSELFHASRNLNLNMSRTSINMNSITEDSLAMNLMSKVKSLEASYQNSYSICHKFFSLKIVDTSLLSKIFKLKSRFKSLAPPESYQELVPVVISKYLSETEAEVHNLIKDQTLFDEVWPIISKVFMDLLGFASGKFLEKSSKPIINYLKVSSLATKAEKKIAIFQKEARKLSGERKIENHEITPVRNSVNRSISSADKQTYFLHQKVAELTETVSKLKLERNTLKAWKENVLKLPGNFSEDSNTIIKEQETCKKQLSTQNKVLTSRLNLICTTVQKFLIDTSAFQKNFREKEGFNSLNFYDTERCKLEQKLKEFGEWKEKTPIFSPVHTPSRKANLSVDLSQFARKMPSFENENKVLRNQLREYKKTIKHLEIKCAELENNRWQAEKEKQSLERKARNSVTPKNLTQTYQKALDLAKQLAENKISSISLEFEQKFLTIQQKISEKEISFNELRTRFTESLKENLNTLIAMNEDLKNSNSEKSNDSVRVQLENLEYIIEQNRAYSDIKIQELNETIEIIDSERSGLMKTNKTLEKENFALKIEANKVKDLENSLKASKLMVVELEENNKIYCNNVRHLKQNEMKIDQISFEKAILQADVGKLVEEIAQKDKYIMELQETLKSEEYQANSYLEDLVFKEKTAKSQIEMLKIEVSNYRAELEALEDSQKSNLDHINLLEQRLKSSLAVNSKKEVSKSNPVSPIISEDSFSEIFALKQTAFQSELEEEKKFNIRLHEQMRVLKDHIRDIEKQNLHSQQLRELTFKEIFTKLINVLPIINSEIEEILDCTMEILSFTIEETMTFKLLREKTKLNQQQS